MGFNATDSEAPECAIKYRLVEAEEVSNKSHASFSSRANRSKRKGRLNWCQYPHDSEAAPEGDAFQAILVNSSSSDVRTRKLHQQGRRGSRSGGKFSGRREYRDSKGSYVNGVYVPNVDTRVTAQWAKNQMYVVIFS